MYYLAAMDGIRQLSGVAEAIDVLGGTAVIEHLTGVGKSTISWWRKTNRFPSRFYLVISNALAEEGYGVDPALCGQVTECEEVTA